MYVLGIGDVTHDTSVCLMKNQTVVVAIEEERLTRIKHNLILDSTKYTLEEQGEHFYSSVKRLVKERESKHKQHVEYCLASAKIKFHQIDSIVISSLFSDLPFRHNACFIHHHVAHAASAFFPSPFESAAILVIDGYGAYTEGKSECVLYGRGENNHFEILDFVAGYGDFSPEERQKNLKDTHIIFKNSPGVFYQNISLLIGMGHFGEGKVMGLAAYGNDRPEFNKLRGYIDLLSDGKLNIDNRSIFIYCSELIQKAKHSLNDEKLFQFYADLAYTHQTLLEEMIIHCCNHLYQSTGEKNVCLAGGVALNSVANHKILEKTKFENIFVQPAAGDSGISIGCAMYGTYMLAKKSRKKQIGKIFSPYLGRSYTKNEINVAIKKYASQLKEHKPEGDVLHHIAKLIGQGKIVAWFQGGSEIGPRALGNRSILADPRYEDVKNKLNQEIKYRESFRPFAPAVLKEHAHEYFDMAADSFYMLLVSQVKKEKRSIIPAVTHVDGSARVQMVQQEINPNFYRLIRHFYELTGIPLLLNTSFNGRGEPIVETPEDAIRCFLNSGVDVLYLEGLVFESATTLRELAQDVPTYSSAWRA